MNYLSDENMPVAESIICSRLVHAGIKGRGLRIGCHCFEPEAGLGKSAKPVLKSALRAALFMMARLKRFLRAICSYCAYYEQKNGKKMRPAFYVPNASFQH